jgi:hypothetical protein
LNSFFFCYGAPLTGGRGVEVKIFFLSLLNASIWSIKMYAKPDPCGNTQEITAKYFVLVDGR